MKLGCILPTANRAIAKVIKDFIKEDYVADELISFETQVEIHKANASIFKKIID
jgi:hypothetical protein